MPVAVRSKQKIVKLKSLLSSQFDMNDLPLEEGEV